MKSPKSILLMLFSFLMLISNSYAQDKPHVVLVVGTHHYSAHLTIPPFAKELERHGFRITVVMGVGDPEKKTESVLPGIRALDDADVAIFYMRFLNLPDKEWNHLESYIKSGKPVIGLRTTNHAIKYPEGHPRSDWNEGFGRRVLGTPYVAHQATKTNINIVKKYDSHPILNGVAKSNWESWSKLYLTRLEAGCVPLVNGEGEGKARLLEKPFGTIQVNESETDIVAWTWKNEWGANVFATTLGHTQDFSQESFTRMLVNSVCWAANRPPPDANETITTWDIKMAVPSKFKERKK